MSRLLAAIATTRFGMGARPGEITAAAQDPRGWLKRQIRADAARMKGGALPSSLQVIASQPAAYGIAGAERGLSRPAVDLGDKMQAEIGARLRHAIATPSPFAERWARFWSNHFTTAARNVEMRGLVGPFEREAIRPNVFGSFRDLLRKASFHPGMLVYLDAHRSVSPSSAAAQARGLGLNENLAREILELHTLGVGSGYTQADIVEFAKALTGWTLAGSRIARLGGAGDGRPARQRRASAGGQSGAATFVEGLHEPGQRTVLGKRYGAAARDQAGAILDDLAAHPATARHIARKLATHFVSDTPSAAAIAKLESVFKETNGNLADLARAVIDLDEAWSADLPARKFKTPDELMVSVGRAATGQAPGNIQGFYAMLGHLPFSAPSPAGWPDDTASWAGADAIKKRLEWANAIARRMARGASPSAFLDRALGDLASPATRQAVAFAESAEQGFTLAIMSPEFQRR
jgi:uncharacterized protein (DUF1800 family)